MTELTYDQMHLIAPLFDGWEETAIWSCLQGVMGCAWADALPRPAVARIENGDFIFFAGDPERGEALVRARPRRMLRPAALYIPPDEDWAALIERAYPDRCMRGTRYALKKEPGVFRRPHLEALAAQLPEGFRFQPFDEALCQEALQADWSMDFCSQFHGPEDFAARGVGVAVVRDGRLVCGASSYTVYRGGLEVEIATHPDWRRRGLARACAARLILECLDRGLYPAWDAANPESRDLAVQLGYTFSHSYPVYAVVPPEEDVKKG